MENNKLEIIRNSITTIPDYPKPGIMFRDVTSLVENPQAFKLCIEEMVKAFADKGITKVVGAEARGFIFGAPIALALGVGFVPARKPNKLPRACIEESYQLEYGSDALQMHEDAVVAGDRVLVVDDLLATGGTMSATVNLVRRLQGEVVGTAFVIALPDLGGEQRLRDLDVEVFTLVEFDGE